MYFVYFLQKLVCSTDQDDLSPCRHLSNAVAPRCHCISLSRNLFLSSNFCNMGACSSLFENDEHTGIRFIFTKNALKKQSLLSLVFTSFEIRRCLRTLTYLKTRNDNTFFCTSHSKCDTLAPVPKLLRVYGEG